jgi:hypothetical protein
MKTLKLLTVLGLLLAISMPASALIFNDPSYVGPIKMKFDFVTASGSYDPDGVGPLPAHPISWGIYRVDTIEGSGGTLLWQDTSNGVAEGIELSGIIYRLHDITIIPGSPTASFFELYGEDLHVDLYENARGDFTTARDTTGVGGWLGLPNALNDPWGYNGLTADGGVQRTVALSAIGSDIIIDPLTSNTGLVSQKTRLRVNDTGTVAGLDVTDLVPGYRLVENGPGFGIMSGISTAYLDWTGGYLLSTTGPFDPNPAVWGEADPVLDYEMGSDQLANARTTQTFVAIDYVADGPISAVEHDLATALRANGTGWEFLSTSQQGNLDTTVIVPEPLTMIALFGGVAGLGGYIRKRRMA